MQLAIALYNNHVDVEEELEFRKGDILTVLIENPHGFDGWWLCKHKDKCGLCPGNRLQLIQTTESTPMKINQRFSTASMYDSLSNHEYDNPQSLDLLSHFSPESSTRSSGIDSTNDPHFFSSSSDSYSNRSVSSIDLEQLEQSFHKCSIRSSLIDKYRQLLVRTPSQSKYHSFINECHFFLQNYGYLLDRYTYRMIKENLLVEFEQSNQSRISLAMKIIQLIELQLKEKPMSTSFLSNDVFRKLHLEPIEEISSEKLPTSHSNNEITRQPRSQMKTSQTCHSNFLSSSMYQKSNDYDYIDDDDYSLNPLIKCYYRHVHEQIELIIKRYSHLIEHENKISILIIDGKALIVSGHKLVFVLETLHEHLQQIQTSLMYLTTQLCEALTNLIQLLKQFSQQTNVNTNKLINHFRQNVRIIMNLVKKIKQQCRLP